MDKKAIENMVSAITSAVVAQVLATMESEKVSTIETTTANKPKEKKAPTTEKKARKASSKKAAAVLVKPENDLDVVKAYVLSRKAGKTSTGPWVLCYKHISESTTIEDVKKASPTALNTLHGDAEKVRAFFNL